MLSLPGGEEIVIAAAAVFKWGVYINLLLAFFNLIPLYPLDGEKILAWLLPYEQARKLEEFRQHSMMILFLLIGMGFFFGIHVLSGYFSWTSIPITNFLLGG